MTTTPDKPRRWFILTLLGTASLYFAFLGSKINPGGPFISIMHDIIPFAVAGMVLIASVRCLRDKGVCQRMLALIPMVPATVTIPVVVNNVLDFWTRAHARGDLIGF